MREPDPVRVVDRLRRVATLEDGRRVDYEADGRPFEGLTSRPA